MGGSTNYLIKNITDTTKTMLDLFREAYDGIFGDWETMPECYLPGYSYKKWLEDELSEKHPMDRVISHANDPKFLEEVAQAMSFPPNEEVEVKFQWAFVEGYISLYTSKLESFEIQDLDD